MHPANNVNNNQHCNLQVYWIIIIREFKLHGYGKRQTSDSYGQKKNTNLGVKIMNSKRQVKRTLGHVVQIHVCCLT